MGAAGTLYNHILPSVSGSSHETALSDKGAKKQAEILFQNYLESELNRDYLILILGAINNIFYSDNIVITRQMSHISSVGDYHNYDR